MSRVKNFFLCACAVLLGGVPIEANIVRTAHGSLAATAHQKAASNALHQVKVADGQKALQIQLQMLTPLQPKVIYVSAGAIVVTASAFALADGPLPVGDLIAAGILIGGFIVLWASTPEEFLEEASQAVQELTELAEEGYEEMAAATEAGDYALAGDLAAALSEVEEAIAQLWDKIDEVLDMMNQN